MSGSPVGRHGPESLVLLTWPDYISPVTVAGFTAEFGIGLHLEIVPSAVEMLEQLRNGGAGVDLLCPPDYAVRELLADGLLQPLDRTRLSLLGNLDPAFLAVRPHDPGDVHTVPKDWGTTGYLVRTDRIPDPGDSWADFWSLAASHPRRATVLDSPHEVIGAALKMRGRSYNAEDPEALDQARADLLTLTRSLRSFSTDYRPLLAEGSAWLSLGWNGDAAALRKDGVPIRYILPSEGSQIWEDDWAIAATSARSDAAHAFLDYVLRPEVAAREADYTGYATPNLAARPLLTPRVGADPSIYPPNDVVARLERGMPLSHEGDSRRRSLWEMVRRLGS